MTDTPRGIAERALDKFSVGYASWRTLPGGARMLDLMIAALAEERAACLAIAASAENDDDEVTANCAIGIADAIRARGEQS